MSSPGLPVERPPVERYDFFKHSLFRYVGYANELGEAFRPFISSKLVAATYVIAGAYALGDAGDKFWLARGRDGTKAGIDKGAETMVWQTLASVLVPPIIIHQVVGFTSRVMDSRYNQWLKQHTAMGATAAVETTIAGAVASSTTAAASTAATTASLPPMPMIFRSVYRKLLPSLFGLAAIPVIVHPIDAGADLVIKHIYRPIANFILYNDKPRT